MSAPRIIDGTVYIPGKDEDSDLIPFLAEEDLFR